MSRKVQIILVLALITLGAAVRIHLLATSPNTFSVEAEGYSKIQLMLQWDQSPLLYPDVNFGPLHMPMLKAPWKLFGSLVMANRIMALLFGIGLLPLAYLLARRLFGVPAALGTLAFLTAAAVPVKTSVVTLAEGPAAFFMVLGLLMITIYTDQTKDNLPTFVLAILSFWAMTMLRFETWLFLPILPLWLWRKKGFVRAAVFCAALAAPPLVHLWVCNKITGDPFVFLHTSAAITAMNSAGVPIAQRVFGLVNSIGYTAGWAMLAILPFALAMVPGRKRGRLIGLMLGATLLMYQFKITQATLAPELYRYLMVPTVLIALIWSLPLIVLSKRKAWHRTATLGIVTVVFGLVLSGLSYRTVIAEARPLVPNQEVFELLKIMRTDLTTADRIFLGYENHPLIVVESGLNWENFRYPINPDNANASIQSVRHIFNEYRPTVILEYSNDPLFSQVLKFTPPCGQTQTVFDVSYCRQGHNGKWCWYRKCENDPT